MIRRDFNWSYERTRGTTRNTFGDSKISKDRGAVGTNGGMMCRGETSEAVTRRGQIRFGCAMNKTLYAAITTTLEDACGRRTGAETRASEGMAAVGLAIPTGGPTSSSLIALPVEPAAQVAKEPAPNLVKAANSAKGTWPHGEEANGSHQKEAGECRDNTEGGVLSLGRRR